MLGVQRNTFNDLVYCELGRFPLIIHRKLRIVKYWLKVKQSENCILKSCYDECVNINDVWVANIKQELSSIGLEFMFENNLPVNVAFKIIEQRIFDNCRQNMLANISRAPRVFLSQYLVDIFVYNFTYVNLKKPSTNVLLPVSDCHLII